jgi:unsaturated rhamnogalacturonyl hydrolase
MQSSNLEGRRGLSVIAAAALVMTLACTGGGTASHNGGNSTTTSVSGGSGGTAGTSGGSGGIVGAGGVGTGGMATLAGTGGAPPATGRTVSGIGGTTNQGSGGMTPASGGTGGNGGTTTGAGGSTVPATGGTTATTSARGGAGATGTGGLAGNRTGGSTSSGGTTAGATGGSGSGGASASGGSVGTGGTTGTGGAPAWCLPLSAHPQGIDWAKALVDGRKNTSLGWFYADGLYLHGVYFAYKRLGDASYLAQIKSWADRNVNGSASYDSLDAMQPTLALLDMYRETKDAKYGTAPAAVAKRLETNYPKTNDGGFWHTDTGSFGANQLWGDGVFMNLPPYVNYGELFSNSKAIDTATQQLIIYDKHLATPSNLHVHQWNASTNKQSCCVWCRAEGWYEMALLMVLDFVPATHPDRGALLEIVQRLAKGVAATQDPATGRWWQVMDKPNESGNWLETSCTAMHTYFLSRASEKGYIDAATYAPLAIKGFTGEMQMVSSPSNVQIKNICPGTGVLASAAEYYARPPSTNDNHGLGAFLLMYDQLTCR